MPQPLSYQRITTSPHKVLTKFVLAFFLVTCTALFVTPANAIVGGKKATKSGSTVAILTPTGKCTGTLVARNVVLTAGHCVKELSLTDIKQIRVYAGVLDHSVTPKPSGDFIVTRARESQDYETGADKKITPNDLAYLELGREAVPTPTPIGYGRPKIGINQRIRGFGRLADTDAGRTPILHEALVRIVSCGKGSFYDVFCSGFTQSNPDAGTCRGDSGGPLLSPLTGKLFGVTSGGGTGCKTRSVYVDLTEHRPFISQAVEPRITGRVFSLPSTATAEANGARPDDARIANAVPSAVVRARCLDGTLKSSTPIVEGRFTLPVKAGTYNLEVTSKGYKTLFVRDFVVKTPRALDAGLVPGVTPPPQDPSAGPQIATIASAERYASGKLVLDVGINSDPGATRKVTVKIASPATCTRSVLSAGTKSFTITRPTSKLVGFDLSAAAASRLGIGDKVSISVFLDDKFERKKEMIITKPSKSTGG